MGRPTALRPSADLSAVCFVLAFFSFLLGWAMAWAAAEDLVAFYYGPRPLAVTHTFALGWVSLTIIGVLYQFVPALTKQPLPWPRLVPWQIGLYTLGAHALVLNLWLGSPAGAAWGAALLLLGVLLFVAEMAVPLRNSPLADPTLLGIAVAVFFFFLTAVLGTLYAADKVYPYLPGGVLTNVAAHAHAALGGWITVTICAVSYRMVAAFLLPEVPFPATARPQIIFLSASLLAFTASLLLSSILTGLFALLIVLALLWYAAILWQFVRTRHMPIDWSIGHVLAALACLALACACGLALTFFVDPQGQGGNRLVVAYGALLFVGWTSNYIVGMGVRMIGGLMGRGGRPLLPEFWRGAVFVLLNLGTLTVVAAVLTAHVALLRGAVSLFLASGLVLALAVVGRWVPRKPAPSKAVREREEANSSRRRGSG